MAKNTYGRYFVGLIIVLSAFTSCSKKVTSPVTPKNLFTYSVTGLSDINILQYNDTVVYGSVKLAVAGGISDSIMVAFDSIPLGVAIMPLTYTMVPDFHEVLTMTIKIDTVGTYPIVVRTSSPSADTQRHRLNIVVAPNTDCSEAITGVYTVSTICMDGPHVADFKGTVTKRGPGKVTLPIFSGNGLPADLNCNSSTMATEATGNAYPGSGHYNANTIQLSFDYIDVAHDNNDYTCYVTYKR